MQKYSERILLSGFAIIFSILTALMWMPGRLSPQYAEIVPYVLRFAILAMLAAVLWGVRQVHHAGQLAHDRTIRTLESLSDGFFSLDNNWNFTYVNAEGERILKKQRGELLGKNIWEIYPEAVGSVYQQEYERALAEQRTIVFETHDAIAGTWCELRAHPSADGVAVYLHYTTEARIAKEELQMLAATLKYALEGIARVDAAGRYIAVNPAYAHTCGFEPAEMMGMDWMQTIPLDDQSTMQAAYQAMTARGKVEIEVRGVRKDGSQFHQALVLIAVAGPDDAAAGHHCFMKDISQRRESGQALRDSEARFHAFINQGAMHAWITNEAGTIEYLNEPYCAMIGRTAEQCIGKNVSSVFPAPWSDVILDKIRQVAQTGKTLETVEEAPLPDGKLHHFLVHKFLLGQANGHIRVGGSAIDVTDLVESEREQARLTAVLEATNTEIEMQMLLVNEQASALESQKAELELANERLEGLATTDGLTGVKNHRTFQQKLREEVERSIRTNAPLSVILLDVDKFKSFNDTHGHPAGDGVLRKVAKVLEETARSTDMVARYEGEEFAIILTETDAGSAMRAAERCRTAIENAPWSERQITASFGVATWSLALPNAATLIENTDKALYRSKQQGRNRTTYFTDMDSPNLCPAVL